MTPYFQPRGGWIEIICGSMFSGKTEELIRRVRRAEIAKQHVQVFKPQLDDRYDAIARGITRRRPLLGGRHRRPA